MSNAALNTNSQYWMFTINNPQPDYEPVRVWPDVAYAIWQLERGANGTPHFQGYVVFQRKKRGTWVKKHCHAFAHWEPREGSHAQAKA